MNSIGDMKRSIKTGGDHDGWIKLDGRLKSTLSTTHQTELNNLGLTDNNIPGGHPNAFACYYLYLG